MSIHIAQPGEDGSDGSGQLELPEALPVLPLRDSVPFPGTLTPLAIGQERSVKLVNDVLAGNRMLLMVASKDAEAESPGPDEIYRVGVAGFVARMLKVPDGSLRILVQGGERVELTDFVASEPYMVARIEPRPDIVEDGDELEALVRNVQNTFSQIIADVPYLPEELHARGSQPRGPGRAGAHDRRLAPAQHARRSRSCSRSGTSPSASGASRSCSRASSS